MINYIYYHSHSLDPYFNLAYETYLLENIKDRILVFTYSNDPCVVIGHFQNPWTECNLTSMRENNVNLVRRFSGGGAVYHDRGNLNISFIHPTREYYKNDNSKLVQELLESNGFKILVNDRNDLRLIRENDPIEYKISGSAYKQKLDRSYHHMTLLFNSDLEKLNFYLRSPVEKDIKLSKGIQSVRSTVLNLRDVIPSFTMDKLSESFGKQAITYYEISDSFKIPRVSELRDELMSFKHQYLKTPKMELHFKNSSMDCLITIFRGKLSLEFSKGAPSEEEYKELNQNLELDFSPELIAAMRGASYYLNNLNIRELVEYLSKFWA